MSHSSNNICILAADNWIGVSIVQEIMRKSTPGREPPHREVSDVNKVYCGVFNARNRRSVELATLGAELVEISPQNESQWSHILKNVKGVIIAPPMENRPTFEEDMHCILECVKKANVQAAVLISSVGVELHSGHGGSRQEEQYYMRIFEKLKRIEQAFQQAGQKGRWNIVRLSLSQQMLLQFSRLIQESGQLMLPSKEGKCAFVNLNDVAHCVCKLITNPQQHDDPGHGQPGQPGQGRAYKLTGPEPLDGRRIVDQMNQNAEADVKFQNVDLNVTERYLRYELGEQGLALAHYYTAMLILMQQGKLDFKTDDVKKLSGKEATKIGTLFKEYAQLFKP